MGKSVTISLREMERNPKKEELSDEDLELLDQKPTRRSQCVGGPRPCVHVSCPYHLYLETKRSGSIHVNQPSKEPDELKETCALDVAERGRHTNEEVAELLGVTHKAISLLVLQAVRKLRAKMETEPGDISREDFEAVLRILDA